MGNVFNRIKDWWQGADRTQKMVSVFGSLFLLGLLGFTAYFASKPKMVPLFAGLAPIDQGKVVDELRKQSVPVELGPQGAVLVPAGKEDEANMMLAMADKLPSQSASDKTSLDSINLSTTPAQEKEKLKAAREASLSRAIEQLSCVRSAEVKVNFGKESPFAEETIQPSAVVRVTESGEGITPPQAFAIARLVQNAVPGLQAHKIAVINSSGRLIYDGEQQNSTEGFATKKLETERAEAKRRETELQQRLDVAFGPGNTVAMIQLELNMDSVSEEKTARELGDKKVTDETTEQLTDGNSSAVNGAGGVTGVDANTPGAPTTGGGTPGKVNYTSSTKSMDYPSSETHTSTKKAGGDLTSMTISVIANSTAIKDPTPLQAILDNYLGAKKGQVGFAASVQSVAFDTTAKDAEKKSAASAASQGQMQQMLSLLPIGALLLVGFMVAKSIGKIPGKTLTMALPQGGSMPISIDALETASDALPAGRTSVQSLAANEPELAEALESMGIEHIDETVDVEAIRQRIDLPLEQIRKMAKQKPQAVAMLLKSWLLEDRR